MSAAGLPDLPPPDPGLWALPKQLVFRVFPPVGMTGLYVVLFDKGGNTLAFVGPFTCVVVIWNILLWLFGWARRMGAESYEILRKDQ